MGARARGDGRAVRARGARAHRLVVGNVGPGERDPVPLRAASPQDRVRLDALRPVGRVHLVCRAPAPRDARSALLRARLGVS